MSHVPAGLSLNTPLHYLQSIKAGRFQKMDLGLENNRKRYLRDSPPEYELSRVSCPVAVQYSLGDFLVNASVGFV